MGEWGQRRGQRESVCVCSLALATVSFPGMNNLNECNGNRSVLVILFSRTCLQIPSPFPHRSTKKQPPNRCATYFPLPTCHICSLFPIRRYQTEQEHIDPPQTVFFSPLSDVL